MAASNAPSWSTAEFHATEAIRLIDLAGQEAYDHPNSVRIERLLLKAQIHASLSTTRAIQEVNNDE